MKRTETGHDISVDSKHQTLGGVAFPLAETAARALIAMKKKVHNYVQLSIGIILYICIERSVFGRIPSIEIVSFGFAAAPDLVKEVINLETTESTTVATLGCRVPENQGRYHLFRFPHSHEGDYLESISN